MRRRSFVALVVLCGTLAGLQPSGAARRAHVLPALHVERTPQPAVVDALGRQVLLRGVNDNQLGDYYQVDPALPATVPLTEADFTGMAALGFDVVRLIVHWSRLEPRPGAIDFSYIEQIRKAVGWAEKHGIYTVLDMHQDAWGKYIATPPTETCVPGFEPAVGWDGAPSWATIIDGTPTCRLNLRELSPAVAQAFQNFWIDRDGIQGHLVAAWAALARAFADDPAVAGYDLLNEPNPGWTIGPTDLVLLGDFYARAIGAIRAAERSVSGGFSHIVFFEPIITWDLAAVGVSPRPGFTDDPNVVFAPHLYVGSISVDRALLGMDLLSIRGEFDEAEREASTHQTTFWSGEWGWFGDPVADSALLREYARQEDAHLVGGAWWQWRQACGDPHNLSDGEPPEWISPSLNRYRCTPRSAIPIGIPRAFGDVLSRAYPRAAPGRLNALTSDPQTGVLTLSGTTSRQGRLEVWAPLGSFARPSVSGTNVRAIRVRRVPGGFRIEATVSGAYTVRIRR